MLKKLRKFLMAMANNFVFEHRKLRIDSSPLLYLFPVFSHFAHATLMARGNQRMASMGQVMFTTIQCKIIMAPGILGPGAVIIMLWVTYEW